MNNRYRRSEEWLQRALKTIPMGSQTFSKSYTQYPLGVSPYFAARAKGAHLWDVDGNEYVDFVNALCAVTLGYCDPDVDAAVSRQLENGCLFTLNHQLEAEVAELIVQLVPCAQKVRFGKNGSDATAGAVRIARAATGRDHVIVCGYHGWQDWYVGSTTRDKGVPSVTAALTHKFEYNNIASLDALLQRLDGQVAAIILEPMNVQYPSQQFLENVRRLATLSGAVLIFDETITGFRFAAGGAQELFGVLPDMATLGKGLANGFPLSAVVGRSDLMKEAEEVFFSFTMGGETLSLAAAKATLLKIQREPVISTMLSRGQALTTGLTSLIEQHEASSFCGVAGYPTWSFFTLSNSNGVSAYELKTFWLQEMFAGGVLSLGTHNISYAHTENDIAQILGMYDKVLSTMKKAVERGSIRDLLKCEALVPLFKVR